ncbi:MAG: class I SAM-dependent methyltransferase, partial [bacterium]|nr:class I SAM-dependent methyltransferase [bacterium]
MPKTETFDKYFEEYDGWFEKNHDIYQAELEAVKSLIPPGKKGLEIGVGTAKFAKPLGIEIGVEPSKKMAAKAREAGIMVYEAVAEELPLPNNTFDFVLMVTTICFFENTAKAFREAHRVLKKDGFIAIGFIDSESQLGKTY